MARMLVVDDEESIRTLLRTVLKRKGHEVFLADSGQQGIDLFERMHPLITILDLHLPDLNGLEVLSRLRAIDPKTHVIMLTGFATKEMEEKARTLGAVSFLKKGFSLFELGEALRWSLALISQSTVLAAADRSRT